MRTDSCLVMLCVLSVAGVCISISPPGKPRLLSCRSRDKETFACWWEPGSDGGLPTTHRLYFTREHVVGVLECPDYISAGKNSCFFDKAHTSFWAEYNLTVVATNALGNTSSDFFFISDVMIYVKPDPPINVTVLANSSAPIPYLQIKWESPPDLDIKSGWVTIVYQLRFKPRDSNKWETVEVRKKNSEKLHVAPGVFYMIQLRCKLDNGNWSEWSNTTFSKIPKFPLIEKPFWILVFVFSLIPLLATIFILVLKRKLLKLWFLPPVPGPKIRGIDVQLLKSGRSEDIANALISSQNFPPMMVWTDQVEEYLLVSDSDEWLLNDLYLSQQKKKILTGTTGLHLDSEIQRGESTPAQNARDKAEDSLVKTDSFEGSNVPQSESHLLNMEQQQECLSVEKAALTNANQTLPNACYVDIQQPEMSWEPGKQADYSKVKQVNGETILIFNNENVPPEQEVTREVSAADDYSRVKEVNAEGVFLHKHDSSDTYCKKKEDQYTEWTNQKPTMNHESELSKGFCLETIGNGYVDSAPGFIVK